VEFGDRVISVADTVESYTWEGNILDCSIGEPAYATMPSSFVRERSDLQMAVEGPSWIDETGQVIATYMQSDTGRWSGKWWHGFFVRRTWIQGFLRDHGLALAVVTNFERKLLDREFTSRHRSVNGWSSGVLFGAGVLEEVGATLLKGESAED